MTAASKGVAAPDDELASYGDGAAWAAGPQLVYDRLAASALSGLPDRLDGHRALDVGAGTGAATRELLRRGCGVTAVDSSPSMLAELARQTDGRVPTLVGDIRDLPLADAEYDVTVAAFVLNHLADAVGGVRELARVTKPGGRVVATTFGSDDHPIKTAIDDVLVRFGYVHPAWYVMFKRDRIPLIATPDALAAVGRNGGLADSSVDDVPVDFSDLPVDAAIAYRLGMAHIAPFVSALDGDTRARLHDELSAAVAGLPPLRLPMLVLSGRG